MSNWLFPTKLQSLGPAVEGLPRVSQKMCSVKLAFASMAFISTFIFIFISFYFFLFFILFYFLFFIFFFQWANNIIKNISHFDGIITPAYSLFECKYLVEGLSRFGGLRSMKRNSVEHCIFQPFCMHYRCLPKFLPTNLYRCEYRCHEMTLVPNGTTLRRPVERQYWYFYSALERIG